MNKLILFFSFIVIVVSCQEKQQTDSSASKAENTKVLEEQRKTQLPESFNKSLNQHGGLDLWRSYGKLAYDKISNGEMERHTVDLRNRKTLIQKDSTWTIGYDGNEVWVSPSKEAYPGRSARFYHNLHFYFFALPFVLADPGTNHEYLGEKTVDGETYEAIKVTYGEDIGDTPEDQYIMYYDKDTYLLSFINYSVTYYDKSRATEYNALKFNGWQEVNGLTVPTGYTGYIWEDSTFGKERYQVSFENVKFEKEQPDSTLFAIPAGAYLDKLPIP